MSHDRGCYCGNEGLNSYYQCAQLNGKDCAKYNLVQDKIVMKDEYKPRTVTEGDYWAASADTYFKKVAIQAPEVRVYYYEDFVRIIQDAVPGERGTSIRMDITHEQADKLIECLTKLKACREVTKTK